MLLRTSSVRIVQIVMIITRANLIFNSWSDLLFGLSPIIKYWRINKKPKISIYSRSKIEFWSTATRNNFRRRIWADEQKLLSSHRRQVKAIQQRMIQLDEKVLETQLFLLDKLTLEYGSCYDMEELRWYLLPECPHVRSHWKFLVKNVGNQGRRPGRAGAGAWCIGLNLILCFILQKLFWLIMMRFREGFSSVHPRRIIQITSVFRLPRWCDFIHTIFLVLNQIILSKEL